MTDQVRLTTKVHSINCDKEGCLVLHTKEETKKIMEQYKPPSPLKLEVGKMYNFEDERLNPLKLIHVDDEDYYFIDGIGNPRRFLERTLKEIKITEHRGLIKEYETGWHLFETNGERSCFHAKATAFAYANPDDEIIYGRSTFEQLPEPENE